MSNITLPPHQGIEDCEVTDAGLYKFYAAAMIVIFILALPLNVSVIHLFIFKLKFWKSNTSNVFLFNLVLTDFLLLFCLPFKAHEYIVGELRSSNEATCKAMLFLLFLNRAASIAFLTVISIDRYYTVVKPRQTKILRVLKKSPHISACIWLLLLPLSVPTMLKNFECCSSLNGEGNDTLINDVVDSIREAIFFSQIVFPFAVLVYCTARIVNRLMRKSIGNRTKVRRAVFLVTIVMVVFSLCFLPCAVARVVLLIVNVQKLDKSVQDKATMVFDGLMILSYMDCLLDPLVYCFGSTKFKELYLSTYFPCLLKETPVPKQTPVPKENSSDKIAGNSRNRVI